MMSKKKKPYFHNNWQAYKESPDDFFFNHTFEELMEWKVGGYELPSSVYCIIRVNNLKTNKVKEHVYQRKHAAERKIQKLMEQGHEFTVVDDYQIHHLIPEG